MLILPGVAQSRPALPVTTGVRRLRRGPGPRDAVAVGIGGTNGGVIFLPVGAAAAGGGFLYVLPFVPPLIALALLRHAAGPPSRFRTPAFRLVLPAALMFCAVLVSASGWTGVVSGVAWLATGGGAYALMVRRSSPAVPLVDRQ